MHGGDEVQYTVLYGCVAGMEPRRASWWWLREPRATQQAIRSSTNSWCGCGTGGAAHRGPMGGAMGGGRQGKGGGGG
jgi:hypothetical protein